MPVVKPTVTTTITSPDISANPTISPGITTTRATTTTPTTSSSNSNTVIQTSSGESADDIQELLIAPNLNHSIKFNRSLSAGERPLVRLRRTTPPPLGLNVQQVLAGHNNGPTATTITGQCSTCAARRNGYLRTDSDQILTTSVPLRQSTNCIICANCHQLIQSTGRHHSVPDNYLRNGSESDDSGNSSLSRSPPSDPMSSSDRLSITSSTTSAPNTTSPVDSSPATSPTGAQEVNNEDVYNDGHQHEWVGGMTDEQFANFRNHDRNIGAVRQAMRAEPNRLKTYFIGNQQIWTVPGVSPSDLARAGFFMIENDRVQCPFCTGIISHWAPGLRPLEEHSKHFPLCPFIMEEDVGNVSIGTDPMRDPQPVTGHDVCGSGRPSPSAEDQLSIAAELVHTATLSRTPSPSDMQIQPNMANHPINPGQVPRRQPIDVQSLGIQLYTGPKNPEMGPIDARLETFQSTRWDPKIPVSADDLAEAGFFYIGYRDAVKCFHCGGGLAEWAQGDDPWIEHAKMFPDCSFLKLNKSQSFINDSRAGLLGTSPADSHPPMHTSNSEDITACQVVDQWMTTDVVRELIHYDLYSRDVIKAALNQRYHQNREPFDSFAQLFNAVSALADSSRPDTHHESTTSTVTGSEQPVNSTSNCHSNTNNHPMDDTKPTPQSMDTNESQSNDQQSSSGAVRPTARQPMPFRAAPISSATAVQPVVQPVSSNANSTITSSSQSQSSGAVTTSGRTTAPKQLPQQQLINNTIGGQSSAPLPPPPPSPNSRLACKICLGHEIEVVFLPCGHQLACTDCAQRLTDCPVCRQPIRGFVRTFFS